MDFDAVSLYPSAQKRTYYPSGLCHTMNQDDINYYNKVSNLNRIEESKKSLDQKTLFLEVKIKKGLQFVPRSFPLLSMKNEAGIRMF
jgi:hypothetical protein